MSHTPQYGLEQARAQLPLIASEAVAGYSRGRLFTAQAMRRLARESHRVPRLVNILASKAMLSAYGKGKRLVGLDDVKSAVADTDSVGGRRGGDLAKWALAALLLVTVVAAGTYFWMNRI